MELSRYGLHDDDNQNFVGILNNNQLSGSIQLAKEFLAKTYCGETSIEFAYIESEHEREWLVNNYENAISNTTISAERKIEILESLLKSQAWDNFLGTKFPTVKRYGGEGAETMMAFFHQIIHSATDADVSDIVLGMPHRGKLNLLTTMLKTRPAKIFRKFKGLPEFPGDAKAMGDIASHFRK